MSERFTITQGKTGAVFTEAGDTGHGATGQVRKSTFFGRSVTVQGQKLNAGSLIDFLNADIQEESNKLKKGWFFGSSNKEIQDLFDDRFPNKEIKAAFVRMEYSSPNIPMSSENYLDFFKEDARLYQHNILFGIDSKTPVKGIFLRRFGENCTLCICIPPEEYDKEILEQFLKKAMKQIGAQNLPVPNYYACIRVPVGHVQEQDMEEWLGIMKRVVNDV